MNTVVSVMAARIATAIEISGKAVKFPPFSEEKVNNPFRRRQQVSECSHGRLA